MDLANKHEESIYTAIFEQIADATYSLLPDFRIAEVNQLGIALLGLTRFTGMPMF